VPSERRSGITRSPPRCEPSTILCSHWHALLRLEPLVLAGNFLNDRIPQRLLLQSLPRVRLFRTPHIFLPAGWYDHWRESLMSPSANDMKTKQRIHPSERQIRRGSLRAMIGARSAGDRRQVLSQARIVLKRQDRQSGRIDAVFRSSMIQESV